MLEDEPDTPPRKPRSTFHMTSHDQSDSCDVDIPFSGSSVVVNNRQNMDDIQMKKCGMGVRWITCRLGGFWPPQYSLDRRILTDTGSTAKKLLNILNARAL